MREHNPAADQQDRGIAGHPRIAAALTQLERLSDAALADHPAIFDGVHSELRDVLANAGRLDGADRPS